MRVAVLSSQGFWAMDAAFDFFNGRLDSIADTIVYNDQYELNIANTASGYSISFLGENLELTNGLLGYPSPDARVNSINISFEGAPVLLLEVDWAFSVFIDSWDDYFDRRTFFPSIISSEQEVIVDFSHLDSEYYSTLSGFGGFLESILISGMDLTIIGSEFGDGFASGSGDDTIILAGSRDYPDHLELSTGSDTIDASLGAFNYGVDISVYGVIELDGSDSTNLTVLGGDIDEAIFSNGDHQSVVTNVSNILSDGGLTLRSSLDLSIDADIEIGQTISAVAGNSLEVPFGLMNINSDGHFILDYFLAAYGGIEVNVPEGYVLLQSAYPFASASEHSINLSGSGNFEFILGPWWDVFIGADLNEDIIAGLGNDFLSGGGGYNFLDAGVGNDTLVSSGTADLLYAGLGNDIIQLTGTTYHSSSYVAFNVSSDTQVGTQVRINLEGLVRIEAVTDGGANADIVQLSEEGDAFFLHDAYSGFHSSVELTEDYVGNDSAARFANIEEIRGMGGDDIIDLTSPNYSLSGVAMTIDGGEGNDVIWGSDANETISGGVGDDTIFGGIGTDVLTGGSGADVFEFTRTSTDTSVTDFDTSDGDMLRFYNAGGAIFDASSIVLTDRGVRISYTDTVSETSHDIYIDLARGVAVFSATLPEILSALEIL